MWAKPGKTCTELPSTEKRRENVLRIDPSWSSVSLVPLALGLGRQSSDAINRCPVTSLAEPRRRSQWEILLPQATFRSAALHQLIQLGLIRERKYPMLQCLYPTSTSTLPSPFVFPTQDPETVASLREMFPAPTAAPVAIAGGVEARTLSRYLMLWNLPVYYIWQHIINWVCSILPRIGDPYLECVVRTNESGFQNFWMKFRIEEGAQRFRGVVQGLLLGNDETRVNCDFVKLNQYNGATN